MALVSGLRRPLVAALVGAVGLAGLIIVVAPPRAHAALPADLDQTTLISSGLSSPTAFRFTPEGDIVIAEQSGAIRLYTGGALREQPMIILSTVGSDERGLLGLELDPDYQSNHHVYVSYTNSDNFDRLSRLTVTGTMIDPVSEVVLKKSDQPANTFHHGGEIRFGPDGKIYWALGKNLYDPNSQNLGTIHGKILRLNTDGSAPPDNPFVGTPGAEPSVWAYGLRNPFRFDIIPPSAGGNAGKPLVGDVGGAHWEELNVIQRGGNYGWPTYEGPCQDCSAINPLFAYPHTAPPASAGSVTAVAISHGSALGPQYDNAVFYGDYTLGFVRYAIMDSSFTSVLSDNAFDDQAGTPIQLTFGPDGNLYQLDIYPGSLHKIGPSGGNRAPIAKASADVTNGLSPLTVAFSSTGSTDPDGAPLSYQWDFKDSSTSAAPNPTHTFTADGTYDVVLTVSDGDKTNTALVKITVGNRAPTATITTPKRDTTYDAGDTISYAATAEDAEDGTLPTSAFSWSIIFHHADHIHPFLGPLTGATAGTFAIPRYADNIDTTSYEIQLTVTDSGGLSRTVSQMITPNLVDLTFSASPPGAAYTIDGIPFTGTHTERAVVGVDRVLGVTSQTIDGAPYVFDNWSDQGAASHTIRTPAHNETYQLNLKQIGQPPAPWKSTDIGARTATGSTEYGNGTFTLKGGGNDIWDGTDEFRYVWQPLDGDGSIEARITGQSDTDAWAKSGVMIKRSTDEHADYVALAATPANGLRMQWNFAHEIDGGPVALPNGWVKLERSGNEFRAFRSDDGSTWAAVGTATMQMDAQVTVGLFVNSHSDAALNTSTFDQVTVSKSGSEPTGLPAPWTHSDVGDAQPAGEAAFDPNSQAFTMTGGGKDIWQSDDQFSYTHRSLTGDGSIVARVSNQVASDPWAKAGIMIKATAEAGSPYVAMLLTPDHGIRYQAAFTHDTAGGDPGQQTWFKLTRAAGTVTGYRSDDGIAWSQVGSQAIQLPETATVGLVVNAHHPSALGGAVFDQVAVSGSGASLPSGWSATDLGGSQPTGSATSTNGTFTVTGGGTDLWGDADQGQFAHQALAGDGSVVARITGLDAVDDWAKTGLMIRESTGNHAPYAAVLLTKGHGVRLQSGYNSDTAGSSSSAPRWLRLTRTGSQIEASESSDGSAWTPIGRVTVPMAETVEAGLVVSAHDGGVSTATATFTDVRVASTGSGPLPSPWVSSDIGDVQRPGSSSVTRRDYTLRGSGNDVWGDTDQMYFAHQPINGNGSIVARVTSQENTDGWAKTGVMIKASAAEGASYVALLVTPAHGLRMQSDFNRDIDGGPVDLPYGWLKLERNGSEVIGYRSTDGIEWTEVGRVTMTLPDEARTGLFISAHNGSALNTSTFTDVTLSG